jgi:hypothetical protein
VKTEAVTRCLKAEIAGSFISTSASEYRTRGTGVVVDSGEILFGMDSRGHLHLLMPVPAGMALREDRRSEGVRLVAHELLEGNAHLRFADLECTKIHLEETFHLLAQEIIDRLRADPHGRPDEIAARTIAEWRELLERPQGFPLGSEQLAGIFGELSVLRDLVVGKSSMIATWTGPLGHRHDFAAGALGIEVKTCLSSKRSEVTINGLSQLEVPAGGRLLMRFMRLERSSGAISVPDLVETVIDAGVDRAELYRMLGRINYDIAHESQYRSVGFRVIEEAAFRVEEGFPKLTLAAFVGGELPDGIGDVSYVLQLSKATAFRITADGWTEFLLAMREAADAA